MKTKQRNNETVSVSPTPVGAKRPLRIELHEDVYLTVKFAAAKRGIPVSSFVAEVLSNADLPVISTA